MKGILKWPFFFPPFFLFKSLKCLLSGKVRTNPKNLYSKTSGSKHLKTFKGAIK